MGEWYGWELDHDRTHNRIDTDGKVLDAIAYKYKKDFDKVNKDIFSRWGKSGKINTEDLAKPLTKLQRRDLERKARRLLKSGEFSEDAVFTRRLERIFNKKTIRRQEYIELSLNEVTSRIKLQQKGKILGSLYQTWLDGERSVARLTNSAFTMAGDDFIFKNIVKKWQGGDLLSRLHHQAFESAEAYYRMVKSALDAGAGVKGIAQITKYFFSNGDYRAKRILITESARINSEAKLSGYKKAGVKYYQYISVMDDRTTDICVGLDLKVFRVDKMKIGVNAPPTHVNCRSSTKAYFIDDRTGQGGNYPPPKPEPKNEPSVPIVPRKKKPKKVKPSGVKPIEGFGFNEKYDLLLKDVYEKALEVVSTLPLPDKIASGKGSYSPLFRRIEARPKDRETFWHEYGHFIDSILAEEGIYSSQKLLAKAHEKEYARHVKGKNKQVLAEEFRDKYYKKEETFFTRGRYKGKRKGTKYIENSPEIPAWSDIMDSLTSGAFHKNFIHGHGSRYYNARSHAKNAENFANLFQLYTEGGKIWKDTVEMFPDLTADFEKIMDDVISGKRKGK